MLKCNQSFSECPDNRVNRNQMSLVDPPDFLYFSAWFIRITYIKRYI